MLVSVILIDCMQLIFITYLLLLSDSSGELQYNSESTPTTGETVIPAIEWNFATETSDPDTTLSSFSTVVGPESPYYLKVQSTDLPSKRLSETSNDDPKPDLTISNVLATDSGKKIATATIRKPHFPLKCPVSEQNNEPKYANQMTSQKKVKKIDLKVKMHTFSH